MPCPASHRLISGRLGSPSTWRRTRPSSSRTSRPKRRSPSRIAGRDAVEAQLDLEAPLRGAERHLADHPPFLHEGDPVARHLDLAQEVRVQEDGRAPGLEVADHVADEEAAEGVEPRGGLVEEDELGLAEERLGQPDPLLHALAVLPEAPVCGIDELHATKQPPRPPPRARGRPGPGGARGSGGAPGPGATRGRRSARAGSPPGPGPSASRSARRGACPRPRSGGRGRGAS